MHKGLIGKKLGMTGLFSPEGRHLPATAILVGPCVVTQIKTVATDGYNALQVGFGQKRPERVNKPLSGHFKKSGSAGFYHVKELPVDDPEAYSLGQILSLDVFKVGDRVDVTGTTKGRGFAGVVKRHGFHGGKETHGCTSHRVPGSVGTSAWPSRILKGKKLPGHYGSATQTAKNLEIVDIRPEANLILIKGAVPGPMSGLVAIKKPKTDQ